jgi:hypothetical protein
MSKKIIVAFTFLVITLFGLSGCDPIPTCAPGSLLAPDLVSPDWREVMDGSSAQLEWSYPDTCEPDQFEIILSQERDYSVIEHTQLVSGSATNYTPPTLDIAEEYFWRVRAKVGSTFGDYSHELRSFFTLPYCTSADLYRPNLQLPAWGGIFIRGYDSLEWEYPISSCIPESYRVELSTDSDFVDTSLNGGTGNPSTRWGPGSPLAAATQYWWRITAYADSTYGPTSIAYSFFTDPICTGPSVMAPSAISPLDWDIVPTLNPDFEWSYPDTSCSPEGTHLQVATTPDFSSLFFDADNPTHASRSMIFGVPLADCQTYYWRVAMVSEGTYGPWSTPQQFVINETDSCSCDSASLPIPELASPGPYEILPGTDPSLQWTIPGSCFPEGYGIDLNRFHDFSAPDLGGGAIHPYTSWGPAATLDPGTQYWWRVFSGVGTDFSDPSSQRSFFTGPECTSLAEVVAPDLISPVDGAVVDTLVPPLRYAPGNPACIPDGYSLHLHTLSDLSDPNLLGDFALPGTTVLPDPLTDCTTYYWNVAAIQDGGYGPSSPTWSFDVDVDGTCPLAAVPGIPATARKNNFCRIGTFPEHHEAIWTFIAGEHVLAVARNPFTTYLKLMVLDQETNQPFEKVITCWSLLSNFEPGWQPPSPPDGKYDFADLPVEEPPPTPTPKPIACHEKLTDPDCSASGGIFDSEKPYCDCTP